MSIPLESFYPAYKHPQVLGGDRYESFQKRQQTRLLEIFMHDMEIRQPGITIISNEYSIANDHSTRPKIATLLMLDDELDPMGFVDIFNITKDKPDSIFMIGETLTYVHPHHRGQGEGRKLLLTAYDVFTHLHATRQMGGVKKPSYLVESLVIPDEDEFLAQRRGMHRFLQKQGFVHPVPSDQNFFVKYIEPNTPSPLQ